MNLKACCAKEAKYRLKKHIDVATCDGCGRLVLAYGHETTYQLTVDELEARGDDYTTGRQDDLWIVAKVR